MALRARPGHKTNSGAHSSEALLQAVTSPSDHGDCPYFALYGIESPGLTASLAIAEHVVALLPTAMRTA